MVGTRPPAVTWLLRHHLRLPRRPHPCPNATPHNHTVTFVTGPSRSRPHHPRAPGELPHQHLASLGRYVQLGEQTSAQVTADADPAARRRPPDPISEP